MEKEDLVRKAIRGDQEAFTNLIFSRKSMLYKTAYAYVRNKEDALDVVSETVYKAYISISKLKDPLRFQTWLVRILINCALDCLKNNKKLIYIENRYDQVKDNLDHTDRTDELDLFNALNNLDMKYKNVVVLKYFQDLTVSEISQVLNMPLGTVKTYLHKALKELRLELKEDYLYESV